MYYYEIWVATAKYHGSKALTYSSDSLLKPGQIVQVPMKSYDVLGIVDSRTKKPKFEVKEIATIFNIKQLPEQNLNLIKWMMEYYPAKPSTILQQFIPKSLLQKHQEPIDMMHETPKTNTLPTLTQEQQNANDLMSKHRQTYILHGDTGTGKTRLYIELCIKSVSQGKSGLVIVPEISLTAPIYNEFFKIFGNRTIIMHSNLTPSERRNRWLQILSTSEPVIVIGTRSAIFSPIQNLGVIIVDEFHENTYKQEQSPYYHLNRVASALRKLTDATLVFGSATPTIAEYYIAEHRNVPIIRLKQTAIKTNQKPIKISLIDIKDRTQFNRSAYLSNDLIHCIKAALARGEQSLLFINRRGTARIVMCNVCGWQATCPRCDTLLTYHGDLHIMRCHTCNYKHNILSVCPKCENTDISYTSIGTKAIVGEIEKLFPEAKIGRYDTDNTNQEHLENNYSDIHRGKIDILVGTQTIAKGLDLPLLSVVGVVTADTNLSMPDFTAEERTFQLISQVIGRVGRGHRSGTAIIQSYHPENTSIQCAITKDWEKFYVSQVMERKKYYFPPFCFLLRLSCRRTKSSTAEKNAYNLVENLKKDYLPSVQINGPAPAYREKINNKYEWQIIIKSSQRDSLIKIIKMLPQGWSYDIDPIHLS